MHLKAVISVVKDCLEVLSYSFSKAQPVQHC